jgi:glycosyltransferase involved in cell wall biosynthesis
MLACVAAAPFLPKADVVLTTSPQFFNGLAGFPVSRMKRAPWILEIRDLWPESVVAVGGMKRGRLIKFLESLEMFAYRKADAIVPVTDSFERYMVGKGIAPAKIHVIKNGVDASVYQPHIGINPLRAELGLDGKFVAAYFGTHGMAHKLETLLEAAALLRSHPDIVFLLVGDGAERRRLLRLRDAQDLPNVMMLDQQPKAKMPLLWDLAAVSIVHLKKSPVFTTVIPSKIFESMAMEKPILIGVEGESAEIIAKAGAGICVEPENARQLADAVLILARDPERLRSMGAMGRKFVMEHFDRERLAMRYESLIGRTAAGLHRVSETAA